MGKSVPRSDGPGARDWDIGFTRVWRDVQPQIDACLLELKRRFQSVGLSCADFKMQTRQTPRGQSTFLSVVGWRGLLFIVDITLIDGMKVAGCPGAALHVRLLDACGDIVENSTANANGVSQRYRTVASEIIESAGLAATASSAYLMAICHFDLADSIARNAGRPMGRFWGNRDPVPDQ